MPVEQSALYESTVTASSAERMAQSALLAELDTTSAEARFRWSRSASVALMFAWFEDRSSNWCF